MRKIDGKFFRSNTDEPQIYLTQSEEIPTSSSLGGLINFDYNTTKWWEQKNGNSLSLFFKKNGTVDLENADSLILSVSDLSGQEASVEHIVANFEEEKKATSVYSQQNKENERINGIDFIALTYTEKMPRLTKSVKKYFALKDDKLIGIAFVSSRPFGNLPVEVEAVLSTVRFPTNNDNNSQVKGASSSTNEEKIINLYKPSVARVHSDFCGVLTYTDKDIAYLAEKDYEYCIGGLGSGFFVNPQGYLATNGHVVKMPDELVLAAAILTGQQKDLVYDVLRDGYLQMVLNGDLKITLDPSIKTQEEAKQAILEFIDKSAKENLNKYLSDQDKLLSVLKVVIYDLEKKYAKTTAKNTQIYVQAGKTGFKLDKYLNLQNKNDMRKATLVDINFDEKIMLDENAKPGPDIALLKVEGTDFPTTKLGTITNLNSGVPIVILGFPGNGTDNAIVDSSSAVELTATKGIVSAVKKSSDNSHMVVQTDAVISSGNSGGPGFDDQGNVFGVATYSVGSDNGGNYNYLRDIQELKDLMVKNNIDNSTGQIDSAWKTGLSLYSQQKYKKAVSQFKQVLQLAPEHISALNFIQSAEEKIANGEDRSNFFSDPFVVKVAVVSGSILAVLIGLIIALSVIIKNKEKIFSPNNVNVAI